MSRERRFVLVTKPNGRGLQVAELLPDGPPNRARIRRWEATRKVWMEPSTIPAHQVVGEVPGGDRRLEDIATVERAGDHRTAEARR